MSTEAESREAAREAGTTYGRMAADLCLVYIGIAAGEEAMQDHIRDLVRNIRDQASQRANEGLGEDLAAVWKDAAMEAARARLAAFEAPEGPSQPEAPSDQDPART